MHLPCITCKYRTENRSGHRVFVGCKDKARKEEHFIEDDFFYRHSCTGYIEGNLEEENIGE